MGASREMSSWFMRIEGEVGKTKYPIRNIMTDTCRVDLVIAYLGALKAGAAVSVLDPLYPADRQKVLLEVACPRFLIQIKKAVEETGTMSSIVRDFINTRLDLKAEISLLELCDNGLLKGGPHNTSSVPGSMDEDCLCRFRELASHPPEVLVGPDSTPTLSFTSGSEGRPKAVMGRHFSLTYYFPWMADKFGLSDKDRFTMLSGIAHDPIQRDIFTPLFLGATLVVPHRESISHEILAEWMSHNKITVTHLTPAMGQILVGGATTQFPTLHHAFFVGDLLTKKDCRRLQDLAPNVRIVNMYGTTETQRAVSYFELPAKAETPNFLDSMPDVIPVGQGMLDVQLLVVDREDRNRICDVGEQGELFLRAGGLAEGYLGDDDTTVELNRSKFISNWYVEDTKWIDVQGKASSQPWMKFYKGPRDRLYRTGDLGHYRSDGFVECTGRIDNQVKIRGFRIELGDIDSNLSHHPFVRENVTTIRRNKDEEPTLVSYIVPEAKRWLEAQSTPATSEIDPDLGPFDESMVVMINRYKALSESCKDFLRGRLPTYAIPAIIIPLARMPLS
jgi:L-aminoadipate-semialdehyde dehydrogenase